MTLTTIQWKKNKQTFSRAVDQMWMELGSYQATTFAGKREQQQMATKK